MSLMNTIDEMNPGSRLGLGLGMLIIVALMFAAFFWLVNEKYSVLFSDVNQQDAAGILSELERMKVDFRLEQGGSRILVPDNSVHETRLKLMGSGAPLSGGVGFEVFDNSDFGMTEFAQKINFQRALQGELTRTIMSLRAVKFARVHLVLPERGLFQQDDEPSSASVTVFLQPGQSLENQQVVGVQRLVAAAVPGLSARQVTVSDQEGVTLSSVVDNGDMQQVSGRLQQKKAVEQYLADKVNEVLSGAFGPNQAMVSVDVMLNFDQIKTTREDITPRSKSQGSNLVRRRESKFAGNNKNKSDGATSTTEVEYMHGRTIAEVVETPGRIERINVGVLVPADAEESRYARVKELVAVTVGLDEKRGDAIAIYPASPLLGRVVETDIRPLPVMPTADEIQALEAGNPSTVAQLSLDEVLSHVKARPLLAGGLVLLVLLLFMLGIFSMAGRRNRGDAASVALTEEQREQLLMDLQAWLASDKDLAREKTV